MNQSFQSILKSALDAGASDLHLKADCPITFRLNRELLTLDAPAPSDRWLAEALETIFPNHPPIEQAHELDFAFAVPGLGRFRANAFLQRGQLALALRTVKTALQSIEDLHLPPIVAKIAEAPRGIVIVAGAVGSGKSTTLAAMLQHLNCNCRKHIITLEDPIEFLFKDQLSVIEQREIGIDTPSFASGLRNVLRQDPDVLVIGEMRDAVSAAAAMTAANIGHLVITTLHTSDAAKSVQRILDFFPANEREYARRLFADTLHSVLCQRLIPAKTSGVIPALEILINNSGVAKLITSDRTDKIIGELELGAGEGMQTFDRAFQNLVSANQITREQAIAHAANPEALQMLFNGVVLNDHKRILGSR